MNAMQSIGAFLQTPLGVALVVTFIAWLKARSVFAQSIADKYMGTIVSSIKAAEKIIPDSRGNPGAERLRYALGLIVDYIEQLEARNLTAAETLAITQAISVEHAALEAGGNLYPAASVPGILMRTQTEKEPTEGGRPTGQTLTSWIGWLAAAGLLVSMVGGCASDNASSLYVKAATSERIVLQAVVTYDQVAAATAIPQADKAAVLRMAKSGTDALAVLTDSLKASSDAYQAAVASGSDAAASEANAKALITYRAVNAVATKLLQDLAVQGTKAPRHEGTQ